MDSTAIAKRKTLSISEVANILGIGRSLAYELARQDRLGVQIIRLGGRIVVPVAALERLLGVSNDGEAGNGSETD